VKLIGRLLRGGEAILLLASFGVLILLPLLDTAGRSLGRFHVPGGGDLVQEVTLWLTFVGALAAAGQGGHLTLSTAQWLGAGRLGRAAKAVAGAVSAAVAALLAYASAQVVLANRVEPRMLSIGIPAWVLETVMPGALAVMALVFAYRASERWRWRLACLLAVPAAFALGLLPAALVPRAWLLVPVLLASVLAGAPVFVAMGGVALCLFFAQGTPVAAVSAEIYRLVASPTLPAIPLLAGAGYVLAESAASGRLVRFFRAWMGFLPGGMAIMVAAVCALFTTFTGGSGVTIIALGGLVYPMLREDGYGEGFSLGLVTASGALGLLLPPSLPVILYSVVASSRDQTVPADHLYLAGLLPGLLLIALTAGYGILVGRKVERARPPFLLREALAATWAAKWELLLPVVIIGLFASGRATMLETASGALAYVVVAQCFITRDIPFFAKLPGVLLRASALMGAVLILLSVAMGLTSYLVDAQVPDALMAWTTLHVHSPLGFLLVLNVVLLVLGSVLEIYSAIIVLAPIVAPLGAAYGIHPVHLGIIFLANLELGFLLPPMGLNLFLASSRFGTPLPRLYRHVLPFLAILGVGLLLITYVPGLSLALPGWLGKR
jgi:tripartite ATP-independent transporter DctM subunit